MIKRRIISLYNVTMGFTPRQKKKKLGGGGAVVSVLCAHPSRKVSGGRG